jgi:hypothetical protein
VFFGTVAAAVTNIGRGFAGKSGITWQDVFPMPGEEGSQAHVKTVDEMRLEWRIAQAEYTKLNG